MSELISITQAAINLAAEGLVVFPCHKDKTPATPHGFKDATRDPGQVRALFARHPGPLIGIATGELSGIAVLDIDRPGLDWLDNHRRDLTPTRVVQTRSGGLHLVYLHRPGLRCSAGKIARGVDVRADGGYVIAWHAAGFPVLGDRPPAEWPAFLDTDHVQARKTHTRAGRCTVRPDRRLAWLVRFVTDSMPGERNDSLYWAACRAGEMVVERGLDPELARQSLVAAGMRAGLPESEAQATVVSGLARGVDVALPVGAILS